MYHYLNRKVKVIIDRPLASKHPEHEIYYPINYGYIPDTMAGDGEEIDAYIIGEFIPLKEFDGIVTAIIHRKNDVEDKLVVSKDSHKYSKEQIQALVEFQERFFDSEIIMKLDSIKIIKYNQAYAEDTVHMWRNSKERAIGHKEIHSFEDHVFFLNNILLKDNEIYIAVDNNKVAGVIAFNENEINQLYIHNDYQGIGLGKKLLDMAKINSKGRLILYTFEVNHKAQQFYERNGFKIIGRGYENEEKLDDIKYEWVRGD